MHPCITPHIWHSEGTQRVLRWHSRKAHRHDRLLHIVPKAIALSGKKGKGYSQGRGAGVQLSIHTPTIKPAKPSIQPARPAAQLTAPLSTHPPCSTCTQRHRRSTREHCAPPFPPDMPPQTGASHKTLLKPANPRTATGRYIGRLCAPSACAASKSLASRTSMMVQPFFESLAACGTGSVSERGSERGLGCMDVGFGGRGRRRAGGACLDVSACGMEGMVKGVWKKWAALLGGLGGRL